MKKNKILFVLLAVILMFVLVGCNNNEDVKDDIKDELENEQLNVQIESSKWNIQFDEELLGDSYIESGNEVKGCTYHIQFKKDNIFDIYLNDGIRVKGTYSLKNNQLECILISSEGEYSPSQDISGKIIFKINSDSEIEIVSVPKTYCINTTEPGDSGWVLTSERKAMSFWPLVNGIKYIRDNSTDKVENDVKY